MIDLKRIGARMHAVMVRGGFRPSKPGPREHLTNLMFVVAEVAEAAVCIRDGTAHHIPCDRGEKPEGLDIELADIVWKVAEIAHMLDLDLEEALYRKAAYNETRVFTRGQGMK